MAYATEEILLVLGLGGVALLRLSIPAAIGVVVLLAVVVASYRQTMHAYPRGGGAYQVAGENLGLPFGRVAASALLTDYVLTVAVSVSSGSGQHRLGNLRPARPPARARAAIGIAGLDRLVQRNVLARSGRAVEAAGDVNTRS